MTLADGARTRDEGRLPKDKATRQYLYQLFPRGYGQQACKFVGMRKPRKLMLDV
jgi:sulfur relay (sulfurtransferase) DsrC/TusE family protein